MPVSIGIAGLRTCCVSTPPIRAPLHRPVRRSKNRSSQGPHEESGKAPSRASRGSNGQGTRARVSYRSNRKDGSERDPQRAENANSRRDGNKEYNDNHGAPSLPVALPREPPEMLNRGARGLGAGSGSAALGPTYDLGLGAQLAVDRIETYAAAHDHGPEEDLSSGPKLEDLERLLDVHVLGFDGQSDYVISAPLFGARFEVSATPWWSLQNSRVSLKNSSANRFCPSRDLHHLCGLNSRSWPDTFT